MLSIWFLVPEIITLLGYANDVPHKKIRMDINELVEFKK